MPDKWKMPHQFDRPFTVFCSNPKSYKCTPNPNVYPPLGFFTNKKTGEIIFRSKYIDDWALDFEIDSYRIVQYAPIRFIIEEYRRDSLGNMNLIGKHDFYNLIYVNNKHQDKFNIAPRIESPQFEYYTCPDDTLTIPISTTKSKWLYSSLVYDTNFIWWDTALADKGAQFNIVDIKARDKKANFVWKTDSSHLRDQPYRFTVFTNLDTLFIVNGGAQCPQWNSRTFLVYVRPKPQLFYHTQNLACGRIKAQADSFVDLAGKWRFNWQLLDSTGRLVNNYTTQSVDLIVPNGGKWFLKLIATNDYAGCPYIAQDSFVVADFMQFTLPDTAFICSAQPFLVVPKAVKGTAPFTYMWQANSGTSTAPIFLLDGLKDSTLKLTIKDANGCLATDNIAPKINASPVFDLGFEGLALCQGDTLTLAAPDHIKHLPFIWQPNHSTSAIVRISTPQIVSLNVIDTFNLCTFGDTLVVVFLASPKAGFNFSTICDTTATVFTFNGTLPEGTNAYNFNWQLPDTQFNTKNLSYKFTSYGAVPVKLKVSSIIGCFDTLTKTINTGMQVKANFEAQDVCNGDTAVFNNLSKHHQLNNKIHYNWRFGNGIYDTIQHPKYLYPLSKTAKTFLVTLVASSAFCADSATLPITILALPEANFTTQFINKTATLTAKEIDNNFSYNWNLGDGNTAKTAVVNHSYDANLDSVTICLTVTSQENCSNTLCKRLKTSGIFNPVSNQNGYKVYPNQGTFTLECPNVDNYVVELYDSKGQFIQSYTFINNQFLITLPESSKGVYVLKIKGEHTTVQQVMVVVN